MRRIIMLAVHAACAVAVVTWMVGRYDAREAEVAQLARFEQQEQAAFNERQALLSIQQARLDGLDAQDPYVVELIAREKFGYHSPGEIKPPPMPDRD